MAPWHLFAGESGGSFSSPRQLRSSGHGQDVAASLWRVELVLVGRVEERTGFMIFMGITWESCGNEKYGQYIYIYNTHTCINYIYVLITY